MQFTNSSILFVLFALLSTVWNAYALPIGLQQKDVINPPITFPTAGSSFKPGQTITVTWDTSVVPSDSPNKGTIVLAQPTADSENLTLDPPLATGFLLSVGSQSITFPYNLTEAHNYAFVLFGDSGNISDKFTVAP
ncbi:hypothetical protein BU17DRAFT_96409 [Hysterangium stoloniferum]|nr:hypothetical protein BU17DRAFT_96409 [Hysterangium stoloniferum]